MFKFHSLILNSNDILVPTVRGVKQGRCLKFRVETTIWRVQYTSGLFRFSELALLASVQLICVVTSQGK